MIIRCPHCQKRSRVDEAKLSHQAVPVSCPHCSLTFFLSKSGAFKSSPTSEPPPIPELPTAGTEHSREETEKIPWSTRSHIFDARAFYYTAKGILLRPETAFRRWKPESLFNDSIMYLLVFGSLGKILNQYWIYIFTTLLGSAPMSPTRNVLTFSLAAIFTPMGIIIGTFIYSAVTHLMLHILRGTRLKWDATFSTIAWVTGSVSLLSIFPLIGAAVASIWGFISTMKGLKVAHQTTSWKAFLALTLPALIIFTTLIVIIFAILGTTLLVGLSHILEIIQQQQRFPI